VNSTYHFDTSCAMCKEKDALVITAFDGGYRGVGGTAYLYQTDNLTIKIEIIRKNYDGSNKEDLKPPLVCQKCLQKQASQAEFLEAL
jgi:hypothetical protein